MGPHGDWLLGYLEDGFTLLTFGAAVSADAVAALARDSIPCAVIQVGGTHVAGTCLINDKAGLLWQRYDAKPNTCYLFRPDQHVCARWRTFDLVRVHAAIMRATANVDVEIRREAALEGPAQIAVRAEPVEASTGLGRGP